VITTNLDTNHTIHILSMLFIDTLIIFLNHHNLLEIQTNVVGIKIERSKLRILIAKNITNVNPIGIKHAKGTMKFERNVSLKLSLQMLSSEC